MDEINAVQEFELRNLTADDMFPMFQIISKIGIREFKKCFESPEILEAIQKTGSGENSEDSTDDTRNLGVMIALDIASIVFANIPRAKDDIYLLISQISGLKRNQIAQLPMATFTEMIVEIIQKPEFKDFFQAVTKLFK